MSFPSQEITLMHQYKDKLAGLVITTSLVLFLCVSTFSVASTDSPIVPDSAKTPGDVLTTDITVICKKGYTKTVRDVPEALKNQIYKSYGIADRKPGEYEIDHLISLELGGSNSARNLWPQSYETMPLNAHVKDKLENRMHSMICKGKLDINQAQQEIAKDWIAAYEKYVGAVPGGRSTTSSSLSTPASASPVEPSNLTETVSASTNEEEVKPDASGNCPASAPVKVSKNGFSHMPGGAGYKGTRARHCYATQEAATTAGFRPAKH